MAIFSPLFLNCDRDFNLGIKNYKSLDTILIFKNPFLFT